VFFGVRSDVVEGRASTLGFSFTRAHVGYRHVFDDDWKGVVILDMGLPTVGSAAEGLPLVEGSSHTMTLKFAYAEWSPDEAFTLQFGSILQNHYITQERFWGLRFVEKTFQDAYYGIPSADLGAIASLRLHSGLSVDVAVTNGEGFRTRQDAHGGMKFASGVSWTDGKSIHSRVYASGETRDGSEMASALSLFLGWKPTDGFRAGLDVNHLSDQRYVGNISGASLFVAFLLRDAMEAFVRWDAVSQTGTTEDESPPEGNAGVLGCAWTPRDGIRLALHGRMWLPQAVAEPLRGYVGVSSAFTWN
jgi:hypothetical protein